ncbi:MAG: YybH family protein, partial [Acidobacteriota bacterium]
MCQRILRILVMLGVALVPIACEPQRSPSTKLSDEDVEAIYDTVDSFGQHCRGGDWERLVALYAEDAFLMPPKAPVVIGRSEILKMFSTITVQDFTSTLVELDGRDGLACGRGEHSWTFTVG